VPLRLSIFLLSADTNIVIMATENDINIATIQIENERIETLKQYTDDEEIIKNVNSVAFNQEELEELYKVGKEVIYLCNGIFKIPDDKKKKIALSLAVFTAPYLFYLPTAWFY